MKNCSKLKLFSLSSTLVLLTACGGSGGSSSTENELGGIWTGTVTLTDTTELGAIGLASEAGKIFFLSGGDLSIGNVATSGTNFTGSLIEYYADGGNSASGSISGTFAARTSLTGSATFNSVQTSTFSFNYESIHERDSSFATISGTYSLTDGGYTETYTVDADGLITGSDTDGCVFNGQISLPDTNYNIYGVNITASNCGDANGVYSGLAALVDDTTTNDTLIIGAKGTNYAIAGSIPRT
tara:strand:- start:1117 stop:1839 length:723 start_codon:yes stop_codon:yes gene_type:complete